MGLSLEEQQGQGKVATNGENGGSIRPKGFFQRHKVLFGGSLCVALALHALLLIGFGG